jgi:hypothetical protein
MQDKDGHLLKEMPGHGLTGIPGALTSFADDAADAAFANAANLEQCQPGGNCYSNNLGFYPQVFYIAGPSPSALAPLPSGLVDIGKLEVSASRVTLGGNVILSATLSSSGGASSGVSVKFYDGDPDRDGRLFAVERIPHIAENAPYQVKKLYQTNTCGVHQLFAVVNKGRPSEIVRRAQPVRVACNTAQAQYAAQ